jgi:RNA-directed DNA polymerase
VIAHQAQDTPREKVRVLERKLYRAAKDTPQRKFGVLSDKVHGTDVLIEAWQRVRHNRGSAGVDEQTNKDVEA